MSAQVTPDIIFGLQGGKTSNKSFSSYNFFLSLSFNYLTKVWGGKNNVY